MRLVFRVLAIWLGVNALLVAIWAWIGWFARRAKIDIGRRRAEVVLAALATAGILGALSLVNPGVRQAVSPIVNAALGFEQSHGSHRGSAGVAISPIPEDATQSGQPGSVGESGRGRGGSPVNGSASQAPVLGRPIHPVPSVSPSASPTPDACPSDGPVPTGSTGPAPTGSTTDVPPSCDTPSPSPDP